MSAALRLALLALLLLPMFTVAAEVLTPQGYGAIRFGMTVKEVESALKQHTTEPYTGEGCDYVEFKRYPGLRFMAEDGIITRADARGSIRNSAKVSVGMTMAKVKALHPSVRIDPHQYDDAGHYLILETQDARAAIVLEEGKGRVTDIRAGLKPAVEYVEGCL